MAIYTKISSFELEKIASLYGIESITSCPLNGGNANSSYCLQSKDGKYIVTIFEEASLEKICTMGYLLQYLERYQFPTSQVQTTHSDKIVTQFHEKPVLVKKWINGTVPTLLNQNLLEQVGRVMAQLHRVPAPPYVPQSHDYGLELFSTVFGKSIDLSYESWLKNKYQDINFLLPINLPMGLIHGDLFYDNILSEKNDLKAFIDFEQSCYYYLLFDLGMAIVGLCQTQEKIDLLKAKYFIKGYEQVRPLEPLEKELLQVFIDYAATATSFWRFWKYNIHSPNIELRNEHWKMVRIAEDVKTCRQQDFLSIFDPA